MKKIKILIVDDEVEIAVVIRDYLEKEGYLCYIAHNYQQAMCKLKVENISIIILDIMLPGKDGFEICKEVRAISNIPILMLSARKTDSDKILSLGLGADDYVTKPFSPKVLVAQVKAMLRRYTKLSNSKKIYLEYGYLKIVPSTYQVFLGENEVKLNKKSFQLLLHLAQNPQRVYSKDQLYTQIWGHDSYGDINTVTVHIQKIRSALNINDMYPDYIKTVWGIGYKFNYK